MKIGFFKSKWGLRGGAVTVILSILMFFVPSTSPVWPLTHQVIPMTCFPVFSVWEKVIGPAPSAGYSFMVPIYGSVLAYLFAVGFGIGVLLKRLTSLGLMRHLGIALVVAGFLWIVWNLVGGFSTTQHLTERYSEQLPQGETIDRKKAIESLEGLGLVLTDELTDKHRQIIFPAIIMLTGGLIGTFARSTRDERRDLNPQSNSHRS